MLGSCRHLSNPTQATAILATDHPKTLFLTIILILVPLSNILKMSNQGSFSNKSFSQGSVKVIQDAQRASYFVPHYEPLNYVPNYHSCLKDN